MKRKKILHRLSLCACLIMTLLMISCDGSQFEMENLFPNEYHKVLSLKDTGEKLLTVSSTSSVPLVEEVHVYKTGSVAYYEAKAKLAVLTQAEMEAALEQAANNNYRVLPAEAYSIEGNTEIDFASTEGFKHFTFVFYPEKICELPKTSDDGRKIVYVMQIELRSESDATVNPDKKQMLWMFSGNIN